MTVRPARLNAAIAWLFMVGSACFVAGSVPAYVDAVARKGDPNAVFVFQAASSLTTSAASRVLLIGNADPCNVFWQVTSSATLGTCPGSKFVGTIMSLTDIHLTTGATLSGRALARNGAVTLQANTISLPAAARAQRPPLPLVARFQLSPSAGCRPVTAAPAAPGTTRTALWAGALLLITLGGASVVTRRRRRGHSPAHPRARSSLRRQG